MQTAVAFFAEKNGKTYFGRSGKYFKNGIVAVVLRGGRWVGFNLNKEVYGSGNDPVPCIAPAAQ
jgi:hypothetical protein